MRKLQPLASTCTSAQPVGDLLWEGVVRYGTVPQTNESVFSFDTGGGAQHITQG